MSFFSGPFGSLLAFIFGIVNNYAWSIIIMTLIIKLILFPLSIKQIRSTKIMSELQPQIKALQEKYKGNKEQLNIKTMELYKENNYNPFSGCLPLIIQLPILFSLFAVLRAPELYVDPEAIQQSFLWMGNLYDPDLISNIIPNAPSFIGTLPGILPMISAASTYYQISMTTNKQTANSTSNTMLYVMPIMILVFGRTFSSGLMIYWTVSNFFQIGQQYLIPKLSKEA